MERASSEVLKKLRDEGHEIYSISRLGTINGCLAEARKTYILHEKGRNNCFALLGGKIHDVLEGIVNGENTEADLLPAMNNELEDMDLLGISFPKDFKGEDSIREGWIKNMTHFCNTYKSPKDNLHTEELFIYKTPKGRYLQGYIDLYHDNKDGSISIYDYKTSSMYSGKDLIEHGYQLVTYALGKEQEGFKVDKVAWIFLKYVDIEFMGYKTAKSKNKTLISKTLERKKIGSEMAKYVEQDLYELGYDDLDSEIILNELKATNMFDCLPAELKDKYKMKPCVFYYELTDEVKQDCIDYIDGTIDKWEALNAEDEKDFPPRSFTKTTKTGKVTNDYFYCTNLCQHFNTCDYIHEFLDTQEKEEDPYDGLFN